MERASGPQVGGRTPRIDLLPAPPGPGELSLDADQERVVAHRGSHLLVLAGPGTGKTTTLAALIAQRVLRPADGGGVRADRVLALTFGRRAARELAHRVAQLIGSGPQPVVATFHAYAFGLVRQHAEAAEFVEPPRLLTAAEQDARVQELLVHAVGEGRLRWPTELAGAVGTRGIAEQVRLLMGRARSQGLDGRGLAAAGRARGILVWVAVGRFIEEYQDTLGFEGSLDYAELLVQATSLVAGSDRRAQQIRAGWDLIVVDEYQDTDPAQVLLLRHLARGGAQVVAVGDPDQAIYAFRGADPKGLLHFPEHFADPVTGAPAPVAVLRTARRFPRAIAASAQGVLARVPMGTLPAEAQRAHRSPVLRDDPADVAVRTYPDVEAEAAAIADHLVRAHAGLGDRPAMPWSDMAVLMRNPAVSGAPLARAMRQAGIPVSIPPDELALSDEPAVIVLTTLLRLGMNGPGPDPGAGRSLLAGPLGRVDLVTSRALGRAALSAAQGRSDVGSAATGAAPGPGRPADGPTEVRGSDQALTAALVRGERPTGAPPSAGFDRVAVAIEAARRAADADETVSEVLWAAWTATDWPQRLQRAAFAAGSSAAHRDLDSVVSLFELANRLPSQLRGAAAVVGFLDSVAAQRLASGTTRPEDVRDEVRLLSAHRAKGLEWPLVVVAGVQEGVWPDVRLRSDLLRARELSAQGPPTAVDLVAEERRLLYVACTRARSSLLVTAVAEPVDGGAAPSRFLSDLGVPVEPHGSVRRMPVRVDGLVAELRRAADAPVTRLADGTADPDVEALRQAALARLAALAARVRGDARAPHLQPGSAGPPGGLVAERELLRAADPSTWWGVRTMTGPQSRSAESPVGRAPASLPSGAASASALAPRMSPSTVEEILACPLRWFLERRAKAGPRHGPAAAIGSIVHEIARAVAAGEVPATEAAIEQVLDQMWDAMPFPARYQRINERDRVLRMLKAFLQWHASNHRRVLAVEAPFEFTIEGPDGPIRVVGKIDRLDLAEDGCVRVVDYKTGRSVIAVAAAAEHPQLGIYQAAVGAGVVESVVPAPGGGELVFLGEVDRNGRPKLRTQPALDVTDTGWVAALVREAAALAEGPGFPARRGRRCGSCAFHALCPAQARGAGAPA